MPKFIFFALGVAGLTSLQAWGFAILGVKPDLALVGLIVAAFFVADVSQVFFLTALALLILKFSPSFSSELLILGFIGMAAAFLARRSSWNGFLSALLFIALGTTLFYGLLARELLLSSVFFKELGLNIVMGVLIFILLGNLCGTEPSSNIALT